VSDVRAHVSITVELAAAAASAKLTADARGVPIRRQVALHADADVGAAGARASLSFASHGVTLATATASAPVRLADVLAGGLARVTAAPLTAHLEAGDAPLASWLEVVGRNDARGRVAATVDVAGTIGAPTASGTFTASALRDTTTPPGLPAPELHALTAHGRWDGRTLDAAADATEGDDGALHGTVSGDPAAPAAMHVALHASHFDLAPLALLAPGAFAGAAGQIDADLDERGLGLANLRGTFHVTRGSLPLSPTLGTLREADATGQIGGGRVSLKVGGALGRGHVGMAGTIDLGAGAATLADAEIALHGVSPIGLYEPRLDGMVKAILHREGDHLRATLTVSNGNVDVPTTSGEQLHSVGAPRDMVFGSARAPVPAQAAPPEVGEAESPWLYVDVALGPTHVTNDLARALITGDLTLAIGGDQLGVTGTIKTVGAEIDILGRRYLIDHAYARFDGTTDPLVDAALSHKFTSLELFVAVTGRLSALQFKLTSDPAEPSEDQLFSYLLGAEPGGDPGVQARDAAAGAATAAASSVVGQALRKVLPIDLFDTLRYQPATSSTSPAVTGGKWIGRRTFLGVTFRPSPLPLIENAWEVDFQRWLSSDWLLHATAGDQQVGNIDLSHSWRW
jgi:translocation and assembly module TamB